MQSLGRFLWVTQYNAYLWKFACESTELWWCYVVFLVRMDDCSCERNFRETTSIENSTNSNISIPEHHQIRVKVSTICIVMFAVLSFFLSLEYGQTSATWRPWTSGCGHTISSHCMVQKCPCAKLWWWLWQRWLSLAVSLLMSCKGHIFSSELVEYFRYTPCLKNIPDIFDCNLKTKLNIINRNLDRISRF